VIAGLGSDLAFTSNELVKLADVVAGPLRAAMEAFDATNARRVGKLLSSIEGRKWGGFVVQRIGEDSAGVIWKIELGL
jgi:hypothetical protein